MKKTFITFKTTLSVKGEKEKQIKITIRITVPIISNKNGIKSLVLKLGENK